MNKTDLERLVDIRVSEAQVLLESGQYEGAYYLAGYALECAIKACICKQVSENDFPNKQLAQQSHQHSLRDLLGVAGLAAELEKERKNDSDFERYWALAEKWTVESRYEYPIEDKKAEDLFRAITDKKSGVLTWIKKFWS